MNILFLSDDFPPQTYGGAGIVAFNLASQLVRMGHIVSVITTVRKKEDEGILNLDGVTIHRLYSAYHERWRAYVSLYNPRLVKKVKVLFSEIGPHIVHAHNVHQYLSYATLKIAKNRGAKVFLTTHDAMSFHYGKLVKYVEPKNLAFPDSINYHITWWQQLRLYKFRYNPFRNIIIRYYLQYVDKIFAVSSALKEALVENGIKNVEVLHNGVDVVAWMVADDEVHAFKKAYNLEDKKIVLFGGRVSEAKGGLQAIEALSRVVAKVPKAALIIMGNKNDFTNRIIKRAQELGVENNLVFTGWISGDMLKAAYVSSDIVLVPSIYLDPFPTINLEAMACQKPVVTTCFGGAQELVEDGKTGYVVNPYDTESLAGMMVRLLTDTTLAEKMGEAGYERVIETFSLEAQAKKLLVRYCL